MVGLYFNLVGDVLLTEEVVFPFHRIVELCYFLSVFSCFRDEGGFLEFGFGQRISAISFLLVVDELPHVDY